MIRKLDQPNFLNFLLIPLIVLRSPQDSLLCHLQEKNSVMDRYWSWIAQWLENKHITLVARVQAPVQDKIFPFQFYDSIYYCIYTQYILGVTDSPGCPLCFRFALMVRVKWKKTSILKESPLSCNLCHSQRYRTPF